MWFYCCDHLSPSLFTVTTDLNVESSRTFGGGKKRATFNTDLSPFESAQRYFVPNGRSMLSSLGKKWSWVRLLWRLWDHHRAVNEPRWRKRLNQEGGGEGGRLTRRGQKLSKRSRGKWQRQMNHNGARLLTRGRVDYQNLNWELKKTYSFELKLYFERKSDFWSNLFFEKYAHKYHKQEMNSRSNLCISVEKTKSVILKTLKNSICILYVRLVLFERNKTS